MFHSSLLNCCIFVQKIIIRIKSPSLQFFPLDWRATTSQSSSAAGTQYLISGRHTSVQSQLHPSSYVYQGIGHEQEKTNLHQLWYCSTSCSSSWVVIVTRTTIIVTGPLHNSQHSPNNYNSHSSSYCKCHTRENPQGMMVMWQQTRVAISGRRRRYENKSTFVCNSHLSTINNLLLVWININPYTSSISSHGFFCVESTKYLFIK